MSLDSIDETSVTVDVSTTVEDTTILAKPTRALRPITGEVWWFAARRVWRFPYRDPFTHERKFMNCVPEKYADAGIAIPNEETVRKPTKTAEHLARQLRDAFLRSLASARPETFEAGPPTLSKAIDTFFELYGERQAPAYRKSLGAIFREFAGVAGDKAVDLVSDLDFKRYEKKLFARGCRNSGVCSKMKQLSMLFHFATRKGWLKQDPRLTYRRPKEELPEPNPFTDDEVKAFFEFVRAPVRFRPEGWSYMEWLGVGLMVLGLRPVEIRGARWEHVNWENRFIFVAESHGAKVRQARQWQPIPLAAWPLFIERRRESGFIWTASRDGQVTPNSLARMLRTIQKQMPGFTWKRWRKTYATILAEAGNDVSVISRLLRHSAGGRNMSVAERHYMGRSDALLRDIVDEAFAPYAELIAPRRTTFAATDQAVVTG